MTSNQGPSSLGSMLNLPGAPNSQPPAPASQPAPQSLPQLPPAVAAAAASAPAGSSVTLLPGPIGSTTPASAGNPPNPPQTPPASIPAVPASQPAPNPASSAHLPSAQPAAYQPRDYSSLITCGKYIGAVALVGALVWGATSYGRHMASKPSERQTSQNEPKAPQTLAGKYLPVKLNPSDKKSNVSLSLEYLVLESKDASGKKKTKSYFIMENSQPAEGEKSFMFARTSENGLDDIEQDKKEVKYKPAPKKVLVPVQLKKGDLPVESIELTNIRASISDPEPAAGKIEEAYKRTQTIEIPEPISQTIGGEDFYTVNVNDGEFYLVRKAGTKRGISQNGFVVLKSKEIFTLQERVYPENTKSLESAEKARAPLGSTDAIK